MLHSTIVSSEAAEETSTKAIRHRDLQVLPQGSYSFGEVELLPGSCIAIQPIPVLRTVRVNQGGVAPHSLPGGARPRDEAILASGQMRGLGEPLSQVPMPFRHGVAGSRKKIVGDREVRRVGNAFVPMASPARDYERNPIGRDRTIQMTASTTSVLSNFGLAPDDAIRRRSIPATTPGSMVARAPKVLVPSRGNSNDGSPTRGNSNDGSPTRGNSNDRSPTRTEVRSPTSTSTSTEVRSPTSTSTDAYTRGNVTVTGGAGAGATTTVRIYQGSPSDYPERDGRAAGKTQQQINAESAQAIMSPRPRGIPIPLRDATTQRVDLSGPGEDVAQAIGSSIASGIVAAGVATIVVFGGLYWLINRES